MAILKKRFAKQGTNSAQIDASLDWATALRVRLTEQEEFRFGACNTLRLVNTSSQDLVLSFTFDVDRTDSITIKGNSVFNMNVEDGKTFYGFDLYCDTVVNVSAGAIKYTMSRVEQIPEVLA